MEEIKSQQYRETINNHKLFYTCFRIVEDEYCGYEVQVKRWWFPFWIEKSQYGWVNANTFTSLDTAINWIEQGCPKDNPKKKIYWVKCK